MAQDGEPEIHVLAGEAIVRIVALGAAPLRVGRSLANEVVVADDRVSSQHCVIWCERGAIWVEDRGSRNGTFLGGRRLEGRAQWTDGDRIRLGPGPELALHAPAGAMATGTGALCVERVGSTVRVPVVRDRFRIGSGPGCDLRVPQAEACAATLLVHGDDEVTLGCADEERPVAIGEEFQVAGIALRLARVAPAAGAGATQVEVEQYPYRLTVAIAGRAGPTATMEELRTGARFRVADDNRAVLLYVLAVRLAEDRARGRPSASCGWCTDQEVAAGMWGRQRGGQDGNALNVLVHRVRREAGAAGFDPWCIEKRRKEIRIRVSEVAVDG